MKLRDAFQALTEDGRQRTQKEVAVLLEARGLKVSDQYLRQVMLGLRKNPAREEVRDIIVGYFRGQLKLDVSFDEAMGTEASDEEDTSDDRRRLAS